MMMMMVMVSMVMPVRVSLLVCAGGGLESAVSPLDHVSDVTGEDDQRGDGDTLEGEVEESSSRRSDSA